VDHSQAFAATVAAVLFVLPLLFLFLGYVLGNITESSRVRAKTRSLDQSEIGERVQRLEAEVARLQYRDRRYVQAFAQITRTLHETERIVDAADQEYDPATASLAPDGT
jgi:hypothetical protein